MPQINPGLINGGQYNETPETLQDGQTSPLQMDTTGNLKVAIASGGVDQDVNIAAVGGTATVTAGVNGLLAVGGNVASGAADSGNPVKIGGLGSTTAPAAVDANDRVSAWYSLNGGAATFLVNNVGVVVGVNNNSSDGESAASVGLITESLGRVFNGTSFDRTRSIIAGTNSTGTGIAAAGLVAQFDDTAPTAITENQFGNVRMNSARVLYVEEGPFAVGRATADAQIKATAGFVHTLTISPTGAVTAGVLTLYDSAAESGTIICAIALPVTTFTPFSVTLDVVCGTGIYVGFDATLANVQATVSYR